MKFLVVFAIFSLVVVQNIGATPTYSQEDLDALDIKELVSDGLKVLVKGLNVSIDVAEKLNDDYQKNATSVVEDIDDILLNVANKAFSASIKVVEKLLDLLENDLNAAGKKGIECIRKQKESANQLIDDGITNVVKCLSVDIPAIVAASQDVLDSVKTTRNTLSKAQFDLENCKLGILCLAQLPGDLKDLPGQLIANLKTGWPLIEEILKVVINDAPPCVKKDYEDLKEKMIKIVDATADCIVQ